jgi:hypothetical protein
VEAGDRGDREKPLVRDLHRRVRNPVWTHCVRIPDTPPSFSRPGEKWICLRSVGYVSGGGLAHSLHRAVM